MAKKRKRRVSLGSTASQHRAESNRALARVQSEISSIERSPGSCRLMFQNLIDVEREMAKATTHRAAKGQPIGRGRPRRGNKRASVVNSLRDRLNELEYKFENDCMK